MGIDAVPTTDLDTARRDLELHGLSLLDVEVNQSCIGRVLAVVDVVPVEPSAALVRPLGPRAALEQDRVLSEDV